MVPIPLPVHSWCPETESLRVMGVTVRGHQCNVPLEARPAASVAAEKAASWVTRAVRDARPSFVAAEERVPSPSVPCTEPQPAPREPTQHPAERSQPRPPQSCPCLPSHCEQQTEAGPARGSGCRGVLLLGFVCRFSGPCTSVPSLCSSACRRVSCVVVGSSHNRSCVQAALTSLGSRESGKGERVQVRAKSARFSVADGCGLARKPEPRRRE